MSSKINVLMLTKGTTRTSDTQQSVRWYRKRPRSRILVESGIAALPTTGSQLNGTGRSLCKATANSTS